MTYPGRLLSGVTWQIPNFPKMTLINTKPQVHSSTTYLENPKFSSASLYGSPLHDICNFSFLLGPQCKIQSFLRFKFELSRNVLCVDCHRDHVQNAAFITIWKLFIFEKKMAIASNSLELTLEDKGSKVPGLHVCITYSRSPNCRLRYPFPQYSQFVIFALATMLNLSLFKPKF